jgi:hypothetical protein
MVCRYGVIGSSIYDNSSNDIGIKFPWSGLESRVHEVDIGINVN